MIGRIRVTRGDLVESEHRVHAVVTGPRGDELVLGDPRLPTTLRSAAKLFQALPLVEDGVADDLPLADAQLALCCASHNSEPEHVATARAILDLAGLDESLLACGPHRPFDDAAARALDEANLSPGRIHNNCSGKHAGMLALAAHHGWEPSGYHRADHPVQLRMAHEISRWSGLAVADLPAGVDGCGIPCWGLPLRHLALAFQRFGAATDPVPRRILDAVGREPFMIGGTGRLCSRLPEVTGGRIVAKIGAEGVYGAVVRDAGLGVALKVEDGGRRAAEPALVAVLERIGALSDAELDALADHAEPAVVNTRGETVGRLRYVEPGSSRRDGATPADAGDVPDTLEWTAELEALVRVSAALAAEDEALLDDAFRSALRDASPDAVEEALLQSYLFLGFPPALNGFAAWRRISGREIPGGVGPDAEPGEYGEAPGATDLAEWWERGERTCRRVYGDAYEALRANVRRLKPEMDAWMVLEGYGKVLGRPGLPLAWRECCIAAILAVRDAPVQLRSHLRGAVRCGATPAIIDRILAIAEACSPTSLGEDARAVRDLVVAGVED